MSEEFEVKDEVINDDVDIIELETEESTGSRKGFALGIGILAGVAALGAVAYNKIKSKKEGKPKKRKKLMWVEVEDDDDLNDDVFENDDDTVEAEEK